MKRNSGGRDLGRGNGKGCSTVIGFDVCQEGNSFSLGLLRYPHISLFWPSDPVKISLFMWYAVVPPSPLAAPLIGILSVLYIHQISEGISDGHHISAGCVRINHGQEAGLGLEGGVEMWLTWWSRFHCNTNPHSHHHTVTVAFAQHTSIRTSFIEKPDLDYWLIGIKLFFFFCTTLIFTVVYSQF